jgi:hypothetical protein
MSHTTQQQHLGVTHINRARYPENEKKKISKGVGGEKHARQSRHTPGPTRKPKASRQAESCEWRTLEARSLVRTE